MIQGCHKSPPKIAFPCNSPKLQGKADFTTNYNRTIPASESCDLRCCSGCKGWADIRKRKSKTLSFVPFIGHASGFLDEILFFIVCAGPAHVVFPAEHEEDIIIALCFRVLLEIPGRSRQFFVFHLISPHFK